MQPSNSKVLTFNPSGKDVKFVQPYKYKLPTTSKSSGNEVNSVHSDKSKSIPTLNPSGNEVIFVQLKSKIPLTFNPFGNEVIFENCKFKLPLKFNSSFVNDISLINFPISGVFMLSFFSRKLNMFFNVSFSIM